MVYEELHVKVSPLGSESIFTDLRSAFVPPVAIEEKKSTTAVRRMLFQFISFTSRRENILCWSLLTEH